MRTRQRTVVNDTYVASAHSVTPLNTRCNGSTFTSSAFTVPASAYNTDVLSERISDDSGRGKANACIHRRYKYKLGTNTNIAYATTVGGQLVVQSYAPAHYWIADNEFLRQTYHAFDVASTTLPTGFTMSNPLDEGIIVNNLLDRARQLKADVLLNIVEANQIWPSLKSLTMSLPNMARHWNQLRKVIKTASGSYLAWKFGVSPILQDVMAINRYLPRIKTDVERHAKGDKTRFSTSADLEVSCSTLANDHSNYLNGYYTSLFEFSFTELDTPTKRFVLVVKPKTKYHTDFFQKADFALSRFASSPASLAWELVPFSFVLDWFVDLRSSLRALDSVLGSEPYEIVSFTQSLSYNLSAKHVVRLKSACDGSEIDSWTAVESEFKHYERQPVSVGFSLPKWRPRFGKNQAGISAALIAQQLSNFRR